MPVIGVPCKLAKPPLDDLTSGWEVLHGAPEPVVDLTGHAGSGLAVDTAYQRHQ